MDSSSDEGIEAIDEMPPSAELANAIDDASALRHEDDPIKIEDDNQEFDEILNHEAEERRFLPDEPVELNEFPEEKDDDDGYDACTSSSETPPPSENISSCSPTLEILSTKPAGRGRLGKKALDANQQELPPPVIRDVRTVDFYSMPGPMAKLSPAYYRQRNIQRAETTNELRQPNVTIRLIDFRAKFQQISIIIDKDDSKEMGFQHACRLLEQNIKNIPINELKINHDIWNFGLYNYPIILPKIFRGNLLDFFPKVINSQTNRPFWFSFKRRPIFFDLKLNETPKTLIDTEPKKGIILGHAIHAELSYGALTSMNRYFVHTDHVYRKAMLATWVFRFRDEYFEIEYNERLELPNSRQYKIIQVKQKITKDITDRAAIFHLWNDGFDLYLNMKGNVHKFQRDYKPKTIDEQNLNVE